MSPVARSIGISLSWYLASTNSRSPSLLRYVRINSLVNRSASATATTLRSAVRIIVRDISMAEDAGEPPGNTNTFGISNSSSRVSIVFSRLSTISWVTGEKCSLNKSYFSGSVANSAAIVNKSRCKFHNMTFTFAL